MHNAMLGMCVKSTVVYTYFDILPCSKINLAFFHEAARMAPKASPPVHFVLILGIFFQRSIQFVPAVVGRILVNTCACYLRFIIKGFKGGDHL